jgi:hypothetical protein
MRTIALIPMVLSLLGLGAQPASAQSEDEQILEPAAVEEAPADASQSAPPRQSKEDDRMDDEELDEQVFYSGIGIDRVSSDFDNLGEATNIEAVLGFRIPTAPWIGLEIDLGQTIIPGEYRDPRPAQPAQPIGCGGPLAPPCTTPAQPAEDGAFDSAGDDFAMQALGIGLVLKSTGRFYATGKYGYRYLITNNDTLDELDRTSTGLGLGLGYRWGRGLSGVELGYQELGDDVESIGLTFFVRTSRR